MGCRKFGGLTFIQDALSKALRSQVMLDTARFLILAVLLTGRVAEDVVERVFVFKTGKVLQLGFPLNSLPVSEDFASDTFVSLFTLLDD